MSRREGRGGGGIERAAHVILERRGGYQRNAVVMGCADQLQIMLMFLPLYSPNLNLIERLWEFLKRRSLYGRYHPTFADFRTAIEETITQFETTYATDLALLMPLNFQSFENASLMAARGITNAQAPTGTESAEGHTTTTPAAKTTFTSVSRSDSVAASLKGSPKNRGIGFQSVVFPLIRRLKAYATGLFRQPLSLVYLMAEHDPSTISDSRMSSRTFTAGSTTTEPPMKNPQSLWGTEGLCGSLSAADSEPSVGFEPTTYALRKHRSAD